MGSVSVVPVPLEVASSAVCSADGVDAEVEMAASEEDCRLKRLRRRGKKVAPGSKPMSRSSLASSAWEALDRSDMSEPRR